MRNYKSKQRRREITAAYLFLLPTLVGYSIFIAGPVIAAFTLSFFRYDLLTPMRFVGLSNFTHLLRDSRLLVVLKNTSFFVVSVISLETIISLIVALIINRRMSGALRYFFRTVYFFPVIVSIVSVSIVWKYLLNTDFGVINYYLGKLGFDRILWLTSSRWALPSIIMLDVWKNIGFYIILFLAGLQNIPRQLYEAAKIDGVNGWQSFCYITLPILSPTIFFAIVIGLIGAFQLFDSVSVMTSGGPGDATRTVVLYIYEMGFRYMEMGYAVTVSMVLLQIILVLTYFQFKIGRKWVFYQ